LVFNKKVTFIKIIRFYERFFRLDEQMCFNDESFSVKLLNYKSD